MGALRATERDLTRAPISKVVRAKSGSYAEEETDMAGFDARFRTTLVLLQDKTHLLPVAREERVECLFANKRLRTVRTRLMTRERFSYLKTPEAWRWNVALHCRQ